MCQGELVCKRLPAIRFHRIICRVRPGESLRIPIKRRHQAFLLRRLILLLPRLQSRLRQMHRTNRCQQHLNRLSSRYPRPDIPLIEKNIFPIRLLLPVKEMLERHHSTDLHPHRKLPQYPRLQASYQSN